MGTWTKVKGQAARSRAKKARQLRTQGYTIKRIAELLDRSPARISEYLRGTDGENWNSKKSA